MSSVRAFLGVPLRPGLREAAHAMQRRLAPQIPAIRWVPPENLHLTLHFFGDVDEETLEKIRVSVLSVRRCQQPFMAEVKGLGVFPDRHRPRVLWLGLEPKDQLRQLHKNCQESLQLSGVKTESRPYFPHLTLGRLRQQRSGQKIFEDPADQAALGQMHIDKLVLYESRLHQGGAEYIQLLTVSLDDEIHTL